MNKKNYTRYDSRFVGKDKSQIFLNNTVKFLENIEHTFCSCGTSYHASLVAKDWIEQFTKLHVLQKLRVNINTKR